METNTASLPVDALVGCDRNGRVTVWNDRARELFGYSEADVLGHSYVMLMPIRFRAVHEQGLRSSGGMRPPEKLLETRRRWAGLRKDGVEFLFEMSVRWWVVAKGTCIVGSIAPVLDEALPVRRRPEPDPLSFDRRIAEALPQLVWITNAPGQLQYCNRRWYDYFGLSEADLVQIAEKEVLLPQERPAWIEKWVRSLANGEPFEHECHLRRADGEARWFLNRSIPLRDENGVVKCWLGTSTDIHDQKLARQLLAAQRDGFEALVNERTHALRESLTALEEESAAHQRAQVAAEASERRLQAALDGARDFVWDYDCTTGVVYRSTGWSTMLGYGSAPFDSSLEHWREIAHPDDQRVAYASFRDFIEGRVEFHEAEYRLRDASGAWRWIASKGKIVQRDADGRPLRAAGTSTDITDRKHVAEALELAKQEAERASRAKSEFLENMSHELRTPLNSIIGFANVLRRNRAKTLEGSDLTYLERIHSNGVSLLRLIDDVLDIAKVEAGHMEFTIESVRLDAMVRDLKAQCELHTRPGVQLIADLPSHALYIRADALRLRQIVLNLMSNAIKFTENGSVTVAVVCGESKEASRIEVRDTGIGVSAERAARIFERFEQADAGTARLYGGTGLGLSISRALCEQMGFTLTMTSIEGEGSTFTIGLSQTGAA